MQKEKVNNLLKLDESTEQQISIIALENRKKNKTNSRKQFALVKNQEPEKNKYKQLTPEQLTKELKKLLLKVDKKRIMKASVDLCKESVPL